jgi:hypothetical protein
MTTGLRCLVLVTDLTRPELARVTRARRHAPSAFRSGIAAGLVASWLASSDPAHARERVVVRAEAAFVNLGVVRGPTSVDVSGGLRDDAGHSLADADVALKLPRGFAEHATACRSGDEVRVSESDAVVRTDALGFFCLRLPAGVPLSAAELRYAGARYYAPTSAPVPREDTGHRRLELEFEAPALVVSLEAPSFVVWVATRVADGVGTGDPVRLVLFHRPSPALDAKADVELGATDVQVGGTAKFDVEPRLLGAPGPGKLVVRFAGSAALAPAEEAVLLERRAVAHLSLATVVSPSDPTEGVELPVGVSSVLGAVPDGWVEALSDEQPVGLAPVSKGAARVIATFSPPRGRPARVTLRFVPGSPGWIAGEGVVVDVPIRPPSPWNGIPWALGATAIGYWVVRAWRRPARALRAPVKSVEAPSGRAIVEVLERDASHSGWRGRVVDAHDGTPIRAARVSIVVPVFDGEGVAGSAMTSAEGAFALAHVEAAKNEGARLIVTAPHHTTLVQPAPPDGVLSICLISRRRTVLDRLVAWAGRAGRPWFRRREPTPLEVAETARSSGHDEIRAWAAAVAEAAFGPVPPDERREHEIVSREPPIPEPPRADTDER